MRVILKILLLPVIIILSIISLFLKFILGIATGLLNLVSIFLILGAIASFFSGEISLGVWGLVMAFLFSPYGFPMIGSVVIAFIEGLNEALKAV